jgi:predicted DsbA family dithiol-disulfide isomerase
MILTLLFGYQGGIPKEEAQKLVDDPNFHKKETMEEMAYGQKLRVSGVPFFVISKEGSDKALSLSGAQPSEQMLECFQEVARK